MNTEVALQFLSEAHKAGRLAQAYIVGGDPKTTGAAFAVCLLQRLFCGAGRGAPCGACASCRHVAQRTHADVLWVEPQKKSRQIGVEQVRDLMQRMQQTAYTGTWKACVICGADRLGREAANAFLKTLEEPSGNSLFLLLTDGAQTLLPTVVSRCQTVMLDAGETGYTAWDRELLAILAGHAPAEIGSKLLAAMTQAQRMIALLKTVKEAAADEVDEAADGEVTEQENETLDARASARFRELRTGMMRTLLTWYRDRLVLACGGDEAQLVFGEHGDALRAQVRGVSGSAALRHVRIVEDLHKQLEQNLPEALVFGCGFPRLASV